MNMHLEDEDLVLHYYGEMASSDEKRAADHLGQCSACQANYERLQRVLAVVDERMLSGAELPAGFERTVWARLEPHLSRERDGCLKWFVMSPARLGWIAAVLVLVVGAFLAGRLVPGGRTLAPSDTASAAQVRERILLVDLGDHLDRSQMVLVELASAEGTGTVDITGERARAEQLLSANRLYRQTATATGDNEVADLLDELERVLVDVAASPERVSSKELDEVRRRIEAKGLLFKVRVVSSELRERQKSAIKEVATRRSSL